MADIEAVFSEKAVSHALTRSRPRVLIDWLNQPAISAASEIADPPRTPAMEPRRYRLAQVWRGVVSLNRLGTPNRSRRLRGAL